MARFLVTNGSSFTPFTYDDLVKPLAQMAEAHAKTQENYDTLQAATSALGRYISQEGKDDELAREMYNNYQAQLETAQNELWKNGYGAGAMRALSKARAGYAQDITRLESAIKARQEAAKAWFDAGQKDPTLLQSTNPGLEGLDKYLLDDNYGHTWKSYSGEVLKQQVGTEAAAAANDFLSSPEAEKVLGTNQYLALRQHGGFYEWQVREAGEAYKKGLGRDALQDKGSQVLYDILSRQMESSGIKNWADDTTWNRAIDFGVSGLMSGVGKTTDTIKENGEYKRVQNALSAMRARTSSSRTTTQQGPAESTYLPGTYTPEYVGVDYNKALKYHDKYFAAMQTPVVLPNGTRVKNSIEATDILYSKALRDEKSSILGFDFAGTKGKTTKNMLSGSVYLEGYGTIDTRYNPHTRTVQVKDADEPITAFKDSPELTAEYDEAVKIYNDNYRKYKDYLGTYAISPEAEEEMREFAGNYTGSLSDLDAALTSREDAKVTMPVYTNVGSSATSKKVVDVFAINLVPYLTEKDKNGNITLKKESDTVRDSSVGIREIDPRTGKTLTKQTKDYSKYFALNKDGDMVANIKDVFITPASVKRNCVVIRTTDGTMFMVNASAFGEDTVQNMLDDANKNIGQVNRTSWSDDDKRKAIQRIMYETSTLLADAYLYGQNPDANAQKTPKTL